MIPSVQQNILDGALGVMPASLGDILALVGPASGGPYNTPAGFGRSTDVVSNFVGGPLVEAAAYALEYLGRPIIVVRTHTTTPGSYGTLSVSFTGTSVPTLDAATHPDDEYEAGLVIVTGGTIGTASPAITLQWTLDGFRTLSPVTGLGTANSFTFPGSGGITVDFAAGTVIAKDKLSFPCVAPAWSNADLDAALTALGNTKLGWNLAEIVGPIGDTAASTILASLTSMANKGKYKAAIGNTRSQTAAETFPDYVTALASLYASVAGTRLSLFGGYAKTLSSVTRRTYRRPASFSVAARAAAVDAKIDLAEIDLGPLPGVAIRDGNGNPDEYDETVWPGLDDARLGSLRTVEGYEGVYVNNPRLLSPTGSDFDFLQMIRVMNAACDATRRYLMTRLSKAILLDKKTGFILEEEARAIEAGANNALRTALLATGRASDAAFVLSRTDPILQTKTLTGQTRIIPLGYPKFISNDVSFYNPNIRTIQT